METAFWEEKLMEARIPEKRFLVSVGGGTVLINLTVGTAKTCTKEKERENKNNN